MTTKKEVLQGAPSARVLVLPPEIQELDAEIQRLRTLSSEASAKRRMLRKHAMEVAGWTRCCRCWPSCVDDAGFCGCCLYNHVTREQMPQPQPYSEIAD